MVSEKADLPKRKSIRLTDYDYTDPGAYFVTINCYKKMALFGEISGNDVRLNQYGQLAKACWQRIPDHFPAVSLDEFIVMPNHIHGIIFINKISKLASTGYVRAQHAAPVRDNAPGVAPGSLGAIVRSYKSAVTRGVNRLRDTPGGQVWHRNYYERVIRDDRELDAFRHYITYNALKNPISSYLEFAPHAQT